MKEHPILFTGPMVRAILLGLKTQTRRVINLSLSSPTLSTVRQHGDSWMLERWPKCDREMGNFGRVSELFCPYGKPGDRLWVRETFQFVQANSDGQRSIFKSSVPFTIHDYRWIEYAATPRRDEPAPVWRPSIFMPPWASRITLEVVSVRAQRVQDISEGDADREGSTCHYQCTEPTHLTDGMHRCDPIRDFRLLWDSINAKRDEGLYSWTANPWVWAITFKVLSQ